MLQMISMRQMESYLNGGERFTLLDVRSRGEYESGRLYGAIHIPLEELEIRMGELNRSLPVIVYCTHGSKSLLAARLLDQMGYRVMAAAGGLASYRGRFYVDRHLQTP